MPKIAFSMSLTVEECEKYYRGSAKVVHVTSHDGRRVQFPADALRAFMQHDGIKGEFEIEFDENFRFQRLLKR